MRLAALALAVLLLPLPAVAQEDEAAPSERELVLEGFRRLVDRGDARGLFGLPADAFWRRQGGIGFALFADEAERLEPVLQGAAASFAEVTGETMTVAEAAPLSPQAADVASLAPQAEMVIVIGPRPRLVELAEDSDFNRVMLDQFEYGAWPFAFRFDADERRRGVVLLADDESARAREASFILATVWALGGVTLGPELTGLVGDSDTGPELTPRGEAVFGLFFHHDLDVGMPLADALQRAETLLPR
ncbi:MAG: hypothetical protein ACFCUW_11630 [Kiloniellaceae bacterium]